MDVDKAITVKNVNKIYKLYDGMKDRFLDLVLSKSHGEEFYALSDINFTANHSEVIGFVGINGSGKSTLSNIIAGIIPESSGEIIVDGQVSLIAVAAGLKNDLTGRDNIELKLLMLGLSEQEIKDLEDDIIAFAELEQFIDQPVKSYSSGMKSRLGFAISVNVDPDILIIDEALSVGDKAFAEKSLNKMKEFKDKGKTMIFVSHSIGQMKQFCDKILWLEFGKVKEYGDVGTVIPNYEEFLELWKGLTKQQRKEYKNKALNNTLDYNEFIKQAKKNTVGFQKKQISRVGKIIKKKVYVYKSPSESYDLKTERELMGNTYYIKRQLTTSREKFFLISKEPSASNGVIGWVNANHIESRGLVYIDQDIKNFELIGKGMAYDIPWGSEFNVVVDDLESFRGEKFVAERTDRVKSRYWYFGSLNDNKVWISQAALK